MAWCILVFGMCIAASPALAADTLMVTTADDLANGDTSCPAALIANPGPDGISLREAITAFDNASSCGDQGPYTITFAPSLAGQTIALASSLPPITQNQIAITGLSSNGQPNLTIDASQAGSSPTIFVAASSFSVSLLSFTSAPNPGVIQIGGQVSTLTAPQYISNIQITNNAFSDFGHSDSNFAVSFANAGPTSPMANISIADITIANNSFTHMFEGMCVCIGAGGSTVQNNDVVQDVDVYGNSFLNMTSFAGVEIASNASNNTVSRVRVLHNSFIAGAQGVYLNHGGGSAGSIIDGTVIASNVFSGNSPDVGIGGGDGTGDIGDTITNTQVFDNLFVGNASVQASGIFIIDDETGAVNNTVSGVSIANNTVVGPLNYGSLSVVSSGGVGGITVLNTIFRGNSGNDIQGVTSSQVTNSITAQTGFAGVNGNLNVDPLFVNPASGDYHIQSGSPAIGAGSNAGAPVLDLDCQPRPNPPAIGAYETGETNVCPTTLWVSTSGSGTVTSSPAGVDCASGSGTCFANLAAGTQIALTAAPSPTWLFVGWGGACSGNGACTVTTGTFQYVTATFTQSSYTLSVSETGNGTVTSAPAGIDCGGSGSCSATIAGGTPVLLNAYPASGWTFTGWSGACGGTFGCAVGMTGATGVSATFTQLSYGLSVSKVGSGAVTSADGRIACGATCSASYLSGTQVTLTATPASGYGFTGWSAPCGGTGACVVSVNAAASVTATFTQLSYSLSVLKTGSGTVSSSDGDIACGMICSAAYLSGAQIALTATAASGYSFSGWSAPCGGTGGCLFNINGPTSLSAVFTQLSYGLSVSKTGSGTVTSADGGIACGATCNAAYPSGTQITLTATPASGFSFAGWGGACGGTGGCSVTSNGATGVSATFSQIDYAFSVTTTGAGTVTSADGAINCGSSCGASYPSGAQITLTATPARGWNFTGWGGACSGAGGCTLTSNGPISVSATFTQITYALSVMTSGSGTVTSSPAGIDCGPTCAASYNSGTVVSLTQAAAGGFAFAGWGGACSGAGTCIVTMSAAESVSAKFTAGSPPAPSLVAAVLPSSRSVEVGGTATAFATIINAGATTASSCAIAPIGTLPIAFSYQTTSSTTNGLTGTANAPVDIPAGAAQSFVIALTPSAPFGSTAVDLSFACSNIAQAVVYTGLNTLLLSAATTPVPDIVALGATASNDGVLHISGSNGSGAFAVATVNVGASSAITATAATGGTTLPISISLCQTNPSSGQCISPIGASVVTTIAAGTTPTFAFFGTASGAIPFDPAKNRIFVQFSDAGGVVRGSTSVAVRTQ